MSIRDRLWLCLTRWQARWRLFRNSGDELNRRVEVEIELMRAFKTGASIAPERCRELAYKLGVPPR
jgi:hypothetical protein